MTSYQPFPQSRADRAVPVVVAILALGMTAAEPVGIVETSETFKSRGQDFQVDVCSPEPSGRYPAVVVVHGHGGVGEGKSSGSHQLARHLARAGYVAMVPHYFGRLKPDPRDGRKNARSFAAWERAVSDTVGFAARRSEVDAKRIGLVGASLGSWVALSVAARDRRVTAVVEQFGGWPEWEQLNPARLPPVLILHGDADRNVPVAEAYKLDQLLDQAGTLHEIRVYPGADHGFRGEDSDDARSRTVAFLDEHLKRSPRGGGAPSHRRRSVLR